MAKPLMPKATAVWLIENTALNFDQIAEFCSLHVLEVQSIADDEVAVGMAGYDPIANAQLTQEEIDRCVADPNAKLTMAKSNMPPPATRTKGPRYTPVARRQDKPDAIAWLVRTYPDLKDAQISRLVGTTKPTIMAVRDRTHWNMANIKAQDPVRLDLCTRAELDVALKKAGYATTMEQLHQAQEKAEEAAKVEAEMKAASAAEAEITVENVFDMREKPSRPSDVPENPFKI